MFTGLSFVVVSLLEAALVNYIENCNKEKRIFSCIRKKKILPAPNQKGSLHITTVSRVLFPLVYIIFNIVYWAYYMKGH